jgi:hypothetical protein
MRPEGPAPKGQESLAQGLPWVSGNKRLALKGLEMRTQSGSIDLEPILAVPGGPFRVNSGGEITQGKPWAMLFWPLRATDWKRPNTGRSRRLTGARRILATSPLSARRCASWALESLAILRTP